MLPPFYTDPINIRFRIAIQKFKNALNQLGPNSDIHALPPKMSAYIYEVFGTRVEFRLITRFGDHTMPKYDFTFIDYPLKKEDKPRLQEFMETYGDTYYELHDLALTNGFKYAMRLTQDGESTQCMLTDVEDRKDYRKKGLTSYSKDPVEALAMCLFKHFVVFSEGEWISASDAKHWG